MKSFRFAVALCAGAVVLGLAVSSQAAVSDSVRCEAARLKLAGKHASCLLKAEAVGLMKAAPPDLASCTEKFDEKCAAIEARYGSECPLPADCPSIRGIAECASDDLPIPTTTTTTTTLPSCFTESDVDGDGFTVAGGDCDDCDELANPGAVEILNAVDDDCDGTVDNVPEPCDAGLVLDSTNPMDGARALDLCQQTTAMGNTWGVLQAQYVRADGSAAAPTTNVGVSDAFGSNVAPLVGDRLLVLSSGRARAIGQTDACGATSCSEFGAGTSPPGFPASVAGCPTGTSVFDDLALAVTMRVPTNAVGFRYRLDFYTFDYPTYVCDAYNDQYVTLMNPSPPGIANGNISFDSMGSPIGVNTSLLSVCQACSGGTAGLAGTGFDTWGASPAAATGWLVNQAPVTGGSTITLRFTLYDVNDTGFDSTVLLDGFEWITSGSVAVGTSAAP